MKKRSVVVLSVFLVVGGLIGYHYFRKYSDSRAKGIADEAQLTLETEIKAHQLIDALKAPPEAIFTPWEAQLQINKIRRYGFERIGLQKFIPYTYQVIPGRRAPAKWTPDVQLRDIKDYDTSTSLEFDSCYVPVRASRELASAFRNKGSRLYKYFKRYPYLYEKEIRPRLLLMLDDLNWMRSMYAFDALVAWGERSVFLRDRLNVWARDPSCYGHARARNLLKECGYEVPEPWATVESLPAYKDDAQSVKDAQGQLLPPGALHRLGRGILHHGFLVRGMALSPDGKLLASCGRDDRRLRIWDVATGHLVMEPSFEGGVRQAVWGPDGTIAVLSEKAVHVWNLNDSTLESALNLKIEAGTSAIAISSDGAMLAVGTGGQCFIQTYELPSGKTMKRTKGLYSSNQSGYISDMKFLPDNKILLLGSYAFCLIDPVQGRVLHRFSMSGVYHGSQVLALEDSAIVYMANREVYLHNSDGSLRSRKPPPEGMSRVRAAYGAKLVMSGKGGIAVYDAKTMTKIRQILARPISGPSTISPDGKVLAITNGASIRLWDTNTGSELHTPWRAESVLMDEQHDGRTVYVSHDRKSSRDGLVMHRFDTTSGDIAEVTFAGPDKVQAAAISGDGKLLATYGSIPNPAPNSNSRRDEYLHRLVLWDLQTGRQLAPIASHSEINWLRFSPDQSRLIAGEKGCTSVYEVSSRKLLYRFPLTLTSPPKLLIAHPIDERGRNAGPAKMEMFGFAKGDRIRALKVWAERRNMWAVDFNPTINVEAAALSNDGQSVAAFSHHLLRFWNMQKHRRPTLASMNRLQVAHTATSSGRFTSAVYSPGDEFLLTTIYGSSSIFVWNTNGKPLYQIKGHDGPVASIRFVGDKLVSTSRDATMLVWDWPKIANQFRPKPAPRTAPKAAQKQN